MEHFSEALLGPKKETSALGTPGDDVCDGKSQHWQGWLKVPRFVVHIYLSTTRDEVESGVTVVLYSLHAVTSSVIYYSTHPSKNVIYLFYTIKIQMIY